jgi:hypothetical protein
MKMNKKLAAGTNWVGNWLTPLSSLGGQSSPVRLEPSEVLALRHRGQRRGN